MDIESTFLGYLKAQEITQTEFANRVGCDVSHINHILKGRKTPSGVLAFAIERETNGAIPASSFFNKQAA